MSDPPEEVLDYTQAETADLDEELTERALRRRPGLNRCPVCLGEAVCTCPPPEELNADADPDGDWANP